MSLSDIGMVASSRRVVSLTARFQKGGASISASRHPIRKPSAPNISHSIIETSAPRFWRAKRHQPPPLRARLKRKRGANSAPAAEKASQPGFLSAKLERIPGGLLGIFQIAQTGPKPQSRP